VSRLGDWRISVKLPPGFVALDPNRTQTTVDLTAIAIDKQGNRSSVDRSLVVVPDNTPPVVEVVRPPINENVIEHTPVLVQVLAHDNVLVDTVEVLAGRSASEMQVLHVEAGFPAENAVPGSSYDIYRRSLPWT
jgi:hypothetical protein